MELSTLAIIFLTFPVLIIIAAVVVAVGCYNGIQQEEKSLTAMS